ncbi:hypothetical protein, partial [Streptomyces beijiangensis]
MSHESPAGTEELTMRNDHPERPAGRRGPPRGRAPAANSRVRGAVGRWPAARWAAVGRGAQ